MGPNVSWRLKTKVNVGMSTNSLHIQAIPKDGIWPKVKEEVKRQPEEYMKYFEDWLFTSDAEIGS
jgi:hypothetical protein